VERAGTALELAGPAQAVVSEDEEILLQRGRARLVGRGVVATPRARVVGTAAETLVDVDVTEEEAMTTKTMVLAAAAAGSVLTVVVVRGTAEVRPSDGAAKIALRAGERTRLPAPEAADRVASAAEGPQSRARALAAAKPAAPVEGGAECAGPAPADCGECAGSCAGVAAPPVTAVDEPRVEVSIDGAPAMGPADARVTIVEFTDYQCRFCEKALATVHALAAMYPKDVRVVLKSFPLPGHTHARLAAEAALAAGDQGKYWEMHDLLLANQEQLERAALESYAAKLGLDMGRFRAALDGGTHRAAVERDFAEAQALGLQGVPVFVINGRIVPGARPIEELKRMVDEELAPR
jgi:protein-disulfide isomerase